MNKPDDLEVWTFDNFIGIKAFCGNSYSTKYFYTKFLGELTWGLGKNLKLLKPQVNSHTCLKNELIVE